MDKMLKVLDEKGSLLDAKIRNMVNWLAETYPTFLPDTIWEDERFKAFSRLPPVEKYVVISTMYSSFIDKGIIAPEDFSLKNGRQVKSTIKNYLVENEKEELWKRDGLPDVEEMKDEDVFKLYRYFILFYKIVES